MTYRTFLPALLLVLITACADTDESAIEDTVDELVDALNARDSAALRALFVGGKLPPVDAVGDSSVIYRLATTPGGTDFSADNVVSLVRAPRTAHATFDLAGSVERDAAEMGRMTIKLGIDLQQEGEVWRIVPGSDAMQSTY
jgi:hypothetical protein